MVSQLIFKIDYKAHSYAIFIILIIYKLIWVSFMQNKIENKIRKDK